MKSLMLDVIFEVKHVTPDPRPYNQQRQVLEPKQPARVWVSIEATKENLHISGALFEKIKLWELGQGDKPEIKVSDFTPLGWKRVMDALEEPYREDEDSSWDEVETDDEDFNLYK